MIKNFFGIGIQAVIAMLLMGFSFTALADSTRDIVTEMKTIPVTDMSQISFTCHPGIAQTSHNYGTESSASLSELTNFFADVNINSIYASLVYQTGDHCAEIKDLMNKQLPTTLSMVRTVKEVTHIEMGVCVVTDVEEVTGQLGAYEFSGNTAFNVSRIPMDFCKP